MKLDMKSPISLFVVLAAAIAIAVVVVMSKSPLDHEAVDMPSRAVQVVTAARIPFRTRITAYGNVEPAITLHSMAEVSGKISYLHPNLKAGEMIPADTVVVRIDAKDYTVGLKQTQADLAASLSALQELEEEAKSTRRSLELAEKNLEVGEAELARISDIYEQRVIAKSTLDAEEQRTIQLRQQVAELQGKMNSFDSRRQSVKARIARAEQEVQNRQTILARTEIELPFDARIGNVSIEKDEFVAVGSVLFEAIDLKGVEITAQLPMESMRRLVIHMEDEPETAQQIFLTGGRINDALGLEARVRLVNDNISAEWDARVLRISDSFDAIRQTIGVVIGVDNPYEGIVPGKRPPLIKGMYTAVDLYAPSRPALVVPRRSVHLGRVYIANSEDALEIRPVDIQLVQDDLVVIRSGIAENDRVIVTDLVPVIEGMPLQVNAAGDLEQELRRRAAGQSR